MILITGVSGFIGKHLLESLIKEYGKENILALTSQPITACQYLLHQNYSFEADFFINAGYSKIETIIHAGAFTPKSSFEGNNIELSNSNIKNTSALIFSNFPHLKKIVFLSTLDVYGASIPITENSHIDPNSLYGYSKYYCEKMIGSWANEKNITHQILRLGHVYGPGEEDYEKIIPLTMQNLIKSEPLKMYGDGKSIRSFIYIRDAIDAIIMATQLKKSVGIINVVGEKQIKIRDLINKMITISGKEPQIQKVTSNNKNRNLIFDNTKMKEFLLSPKIDMDEGLKKEWDYMNNL